ncbi:MAG: tRNA (adenosine(37)-N6)-threonylcarbamoyltransferase complex ATPase subunit type 1 TsaE [Bacilli bacterium]|nr:tRNA (adenosine(37)-N6)-threonylcarbamoyltransferase complex ATPase subunit type 1 TsaE [Bacilli bacterium]MDD3389005.1 tRNA (adenosine(37)-N6)-threonylcarbamoyltransferase complex ATPase subunit type 1 TsaE [Bacilli bacterium]MDD4344444.1 tRNA (adenosine(37)-N6)-threonylcarbamoyltransferase complex ATPase subunit type 1 TsaE [Bacilli bacterium]MDD4520652.1 tRNA (adenosine(37)-N6)-threonylcarbamoyltransferase complex ATPase subunit type 1 TsaE [Bacilli bacterium]MDY0399373.1 tRNA (adenosine(
MELIIFTNAAEETYLLGAKIAPFIKPGDVITLSGDLGAGKTTFVQGLAKGLLSKTRVISPTFNIMRCYFDARIPLFHIDAYRLEEGNKEIGLEEFVEGDGVAVIEWPQYIQELLPVAYLEIEILSLGDDQRKLTIKSSNEHYHYLLKKFKEEN